MTTITRCVADLIRLSMKQKGKVTEQGIGAFLIEWRNMENNLTYKRESRLSKDEHKRRVKAYHAGGSDLDMASRIGISPGAYAEWRRRNGLPPKGIHGKRLGRAVGTNYEGGIA